MPDKNDKKLSPAAGAVWDGQGVSFSLFSQHAEAVELCLFDVDGRETARLPLIRGEDFIWRVHVPGIGPGQHYGYRVSGPYAPRNGHRFNPAKLLLDPYAYRVSGQVAWRPEVYPYRFDAPLSPDERDNAAWVPKSVVVDHAFDWGDDRKPVIPMADSVIYELHIKGFTQQHPDVPPEHRGKFLGLAAPAVIAYLKNLGVTTLELLPCASALTDQRLHDLGLTNYWGYDPIAMFAPDARFSIENPVLEFKQMVKALHAAGLEVVLDVVYNHAGEGNELGPSLMFRGIDNAVYYRLDSADASRYFDITGCGNSINAGHPQVLRLILDCLRYWVTEMHVDGFRFDLATTVARENHEFEAQGDFLKQIAADPVLSKVKLIAEPWDLGYGGYRLGEFPPGWSEWNDQYRDTARAYWRGDEAMLPEFTRRFAGSADLFAGNKRTPSASINFITTHDGFTLRDLVCYSEKHNEQNGEDNRDGHNHNLSENYGVEGPTDDPEIQALRARQQRNMLATQFLSHGVPMLLAGDEINRSQLGNNNAYCQDNEFNWLDWRLDDDANSLLTFVRLLIDLRKRYPVFRTEKFLSGRLNRLSGYRDVEWLKPDGLPMGSHDWQQPYARCITILLTADTAGEDSFLLILNAGEETVECRLPPAPQGDGWTRVFDTFDWPDESRTTLHIAGIRYHIRARSASLFRETLAEPGETD